MAKAVQLQDAPRCKRGLPDFPKFIQRTVRVNFGRTDKWKALWLCKCGSQFEAFTCNVTRRHTKSCGCDQDAARKLSFPVHGHSAGSGRSPTYKSWQAMIARCTNPKHPAYQKYYAGRGIKVCDRWRNSFEAFLEDMGERPEKMTLDRINGDGNYEPSNCRWADVFTQARNRRPRS